jgi:hypothetical protein
MGNQFNNDIFEQTFTRDCSGDRGNTCTGDAKETRKVVRECQDDNGIGNSAFNQEKCSGPDQYYFTNTALTNDLPCQAYTGVTFQSLSGSGTGICTSGPQCSNGNIFEAYDNTKGPYKYTCDGQCSGDGTCNTPKNCLCDASCNPNVPLTVSSPLCDGLPGRGTPQASCIAGEKYLADTCSDCGLTDTSVCIYNQAAGCTAAAQQCNNINQNSGFSDDNIHCIPDTNQRAKCNGTCQLAPDLSDLQCRTKGVGCISTGSAGCDGISRDNKINNIPDDNSYCDNNCFIQVCNIGQKYNAAAHTCNNDCRINNIGCNTGYSCCNGVNCNGINDGSCILTPP